MSAIALAAATPAAAQTGTDNNNYDGFRAEARVGYETPTISEDEEIYKIGSAVSSGAEAGFDLAVSPTVTVGPYASFEESSVSLEVEGTTAAI